MQNKHLKKSNRFNSYFPKGLRRLRGLSQPGERAFVKNNTLNIKIQNFRSSKHTVRTMKGKSKNGKLHLQITHLRKDLCLEYTKNSQNLENK